VVEEHKTVAQNPQDLRAPLAPAERRRVEKMLTALANARDNDALQQFLQDWPAIAEDARRVVRSLLIGQEFADVPEDLRILAFLAYFLRRLWVGDDQAVAKL